MTQFTAHTPDAVSDMESLTALESMAKLSINTPDAYISANAKRWMELFGLTRKEAERAMESHLNNFSRKTVSDEQWALLSGTAETQDHDQESYTYHISRLLKMEKKKTSPAKQARDAQQQKYLFKLVYPLDTVEKVCEAANLGQDPQIAVDEEATSTCVIVDATARATFDEKYQTFKLTFVAIPRPAEKALSANSIAPTLGIDATLPQYRIDYTPEPTQDQYPVPYFFYGTLADGSKLAALLNLEKSPTFEHAVLRRGKLKSWGKYHALVKGAQSATVDGWIYVVQSRQHEDALRTYEGGNYEVVRCDILDCERAEMIKGLTFRFCGGRQTLR